MSRSLLPARRSSIQRNRAPWYLVAIIAVASVLAIIPLYWLVLLSFRPDSEILTNLSLLPWNLVLDHYVELFTQTDAVRWLTNSLIIAVATTLIATLVSMAAGFSLAMYRFRGNSAVLWTVILLTAIPHFVTIIPVYTLLKDMGLLGTYWSLILPFAMNPFVVFLSRQYYSSMSTELLDAARIDGSSDFRAFISIYLPISRPLIGSSAILIFIACWGELLWPLVMLQNASTFTFPVGLSSMLSYVDRPYGLLAAAASLFTLPVFVLFLFMQREMIAGLTAGSSKG